MAKISPRTPRYGQDQLEYHPATLVYNIFTNIMDDKKKCGSLINDTSDHLPVFGSYNCHYKGNKDENNI